MNRASSATGWVRNPVMKSPALDPSLASSYELGWTFNPITGCLNGCEYCYARKLANGRLKHLYLANKNLAPTVGEGVTPLHTSQLIDSLDPFYPRFWEDRMWLHELVGHKRKPKGIFVCDMSDLFGIGVPEEWTRRVLAVIEKHPRHRFYLLTKQPQNLINFSPFPDNCWVGVTITNEASLLRATTNLGYIDAKVKYISFEPLLERLPLPYYQMNCDWVIIGAQTKPYKPPKMEWVDEIILACGKANIPVFLKNNLAPIYKPWVDWSFNMKQEMPSDT